MTTWSIEQSRKLYNIAHWGKPYFNINQSGHLSVKTSLNSGNEVDLYDVALEVKKQGLNWPVLVRITDILTDRVSTLQQAFAQAMESTGYNGNYIPVYPIKVNQQRTVVEHLQSHSDIVGLEAGSKPELMIVLSHALQNGGTIICNGYKDREYIRLALIGQKLGHNLFIVIEKISELDLVLSESEKMGIKPKLGIRIRLSSIGKGNWQNTGGEKSKFGLSAAQILQAIDKLKENNALDCLELIHCHLGSQLANIRDIQNGLREVSRYYAELRNLNAPVNYIDVGGGLGIDYEGSRSRSYCSMNYSVQEYANDITHAFWQICQEHKLPHPTIITESGRAMTAHHAVLITNIIDTEINSTAQVPSSPDESSPMVIKNLWNTRKKMEDQSLLETYHDATHWLNESQTMYTHGLLSLAQRALAEQLYFDICRTIRPLLSPESNSHREAIGELNDKLADKYFCNLSIFQSLPDIWAIDQIFPIIPLHHLNEEPTNRATLQDLTCDSDGSIKHYVNGDNIDSTLPVHKVENNKQYLLGIFLTGAYQEILGDMHNLFGDTHAINLKINEKGKFKLSEPEPGDSINEVLGFVHFDTKLMLDNYQSKIQHANLSNDEQNQYYEELMSGLEGYTYLDK
ncbi:MAG: biosynthetic arginine decarboxylase [Gammaproteobacteria bacterium]|nr:biosynthetic arginine decarboxylase [Gammaproteobacteria bacterium]